MAKKFYTDIDLNGNKLQNATVTGATAGKVVVLDSNGKIAAGDKALSDMVEKPTDTTSWSGSIVGGKNYVRTNISYLNVSYIEDSNLEANVFFTTASSLSSTFLTLPPYTKIIGDIPTFEASKSYVMSVLKGVVVFGEIKLASNV